MANRAKQWRSVAKSWQTKVRRFPSRNARHLRNFRAVGPKKRGVLRHGRNPVMDFIGSTPRDIRGMVRAHRMYSGRDTLATKRKPGYRDPATGTIQGGNWARLARLAREQSKIEGGRGSETKAEFARAQANAAALLARNTRHKDIRNTFAKRNAVRAGALTIGTAGAIYGTKAFLANRRKAKERTQFRSYDVYPEHQYATAPIDNYNLPYYNSGPAPRTGAPRVGPKVREEIIDSILEALSAT